MADRIDLGTDPTQEHAPLDVGKTVDLILQKGGVYGGTTVRDIVERVNHWCSIYQISPRVVMGQMLHETGWFKFGNDVFWWQFNFAGLGATGGVIGHMFTQFRDPKKQVTYPPTAKTSIVGEMVYITDDMIDWPESIDLGVLAVVQHHMVYLYGRQSNWPYAVENIPIVDPRYEAVLAANLADSIMKIADYTGKWATDPNYSWKLLAVTDLLPVKEGTMPDRPRPYIMRIPLRVSHIPWGNPNRPGTKSLPTGRGYITVHETGNINRGADAEMHRVFTHNGGGTSNVSFTYVVDSKEAIELLPRGEKSWQASDGTNGPGNSSVSIETCVNADADFNKTLDNLVELIVYLLTNDPLLSPDRIVQHNHWAPDGKNCPTIMRAQNGKGWQNLMARVRELYNKQLEPIVPPKPVRDPNALYVNGYWIINEILHKWESLGDNTLPMIGYPLYGMRRYTIDGTERDGQIFERGVLAVYEEGTPDGVPKGHPFRVRMLTLEEQDAVVTYAIEEGEIEWGD